MRMPSLPRVLGALASTLLFGACGFDATVEAPEEEPYSAIRCATESDCPPDWSCNESSRLCVPRGREDTTPPALTGTPAIAPPSGTLDTLFTIDFEVSEPLRQDPVVRLETSGGREVFWQVDESGTDRAALHYRYSHVADGSESAGPHPLLADLVDASGLPARDLSAGTILLDFTAPRVTPSLPTPAEVRAGAETLVELVFSEPLAAPPAVESRSGAGPLSDLWTVEAGSDAQTWTAHLTPDGSEPEGERTLHLTARDVAGNVLRDARIGELVVDFTIPTVTTNVVSHTVAGPGDVVRVSVAFSELLGQAPSLRAVPDDGGPPLVFTASPLEGSIASFSLPVPQGADGPTQLRLEGAADRAGNVMVPLDLAPLLLDGIAPAITDLTTDRPRYSAVAPYEQVTVTFGIPESLDDPEASLLVLVAGTPMSCGAWQPATASYACTLGLDGTEPEGSVAVEVRAVDPAGNFTFVSTSTIFDFTPPGLVPGTDQLQLLPAPSSPIGRVTALGEGGEARVSFTVDEPVGATPEVRLGPAGKLFTPVSGLTTSFVQSLTVSAAEALDGAHALVATVRDTVGNVGLLALSGASPLEVDTTRPAPPDVDTPGRIVFEREPWGTQASGGAVRMRLSGGAGAVEGPGTVITSTAGDGSGGEMGRTPSGADGSIAAFSLIPTDRPELWLTFVDPAGNASDPARVRDVIWTATLIGEIPQDPISNPNRFSALPDDRSGPLAWDALHPIDHGDAELKAADGTGVLSTATPAWELRSPGARLPARHAHAMVWDSNRRRVVAFGGRDQLGPLAETWEWDGVSWTRRSPSLSPPARAYFAMAYDPIRARTVVFGGDAADTLDDTWEWDGERWREFQPAVSPPPRYGHTAAFDPVRGKVLIHGGRRYLPSGTSELASDLWEWTGVEWQEITPATPGPARRYHTMATDWARSRVVVFGGQDETFTGTSTVFEWNGVDWLAPNPAPGPSARSRHGMAWDPVRGTTLVFGGEDAGWFLLGDAWEWNGAAWSPLLAGNPTTLEYAAASWDGKSIILSGGYDGEADRDDTWRLSGSQWRRLGSSAAPVRDGYYSYNLAYDAARQEVILFGGIDSLGTYLNETWRWDGTAWSQAYPASSPPPRADAELVYDAARQQLLLFGGHQGMPATSDIWTWDGANWSSPELTTNPVNFNNTGMAYDEVAGEVVLIAGTSFDETWVFDGGDWSQRVPGGSGVASQGATLGWDPVLQQVIIFGATDWNNTPTDETWAWDGSSWSQILTTNAPGHDWSWQLVTDRAARRALLLGGWPAPSQPWSFETGNWQPLSVLNQPTILGNVAAVHDEVRGETVMTVASQGGGPLETWTLPSRAGQRPSHLASFAVREARAGTGASFVSLSGTVIGGGLGEDGAGASLPGISLEVWDVRQQAWVPRSSDPATPTSPATLTFSVTGDTAVRQHFTDGTVALRTVPEGQGGTTDAWLMTDYVELSLHYRLP
ncbi:MAG: hypothetical protein P1V51_11235 [Deltaproteobacteria bacterium]|nr:hypothetical protein [Deltaproteobacteria bacterium]